MGGVLPTNGGWENRLPIQQNTGQLPLHSSTPLALAGFGASLRTRNFGQSL
jgi:hypothetical protein